jgi:signal transduction histidine kinase
VPAGQVRAAQTGRIVLIAAGSLAALALALLEGVAIARTGFRRPLLTSASFVRLVAALTLLASFVWASRVMENRSRNRATTLLGAVMVISSGAQLFLRSPVVLPLFVSCAAVLLALGALYALRGALVAQAACILVHAAGLAVWSDGPSTAAYATLSLALLAGTGFVKLAAREWEAQSKLFEQAKWAAVEIARANARLQDERNRTELRTRTSERERIAREIHDTVGYTLTAVLVQIDALRVDIAREPTKAPLRLEKLETSVRGAMRDVRREVSGLRDEDARKESWKTRWLKLCTTFADSTGIRVNTSISDELMEMQDALGETLYRVFQESLTNAYRHGRATLVDIAAGIREDRLVIRISDNGSGAAALAPGNGLTGMQERVRSLGGEIAWRTQPGKGFDVGIVFPKAGERMTWVPSGS